MNTPKSVEDIVGTQLERLALEVIRRFRLKEDPIDTMQDVYLRVIRTGYIQRYNPEGASFKSYFIGLVRYECCNKYKRSHSKNGKKIENALSLDDKIRTHGGEVSIGNNIEGVNHDLLSNVRMEELLEKLKEEISKDEYAASSSNTVSIDGKDVQIERSVKNTLNLLLGGFSLTEISLIFGTSVQYIRYLKSRITGTDEAKRLKCLLENKEPVYWTDELMQ